MFSILLITSSNGAIAIQLPTPLKDNDFHEVNLKKAKIGQLLFYDKILSGNFNISCGTCHHHRFGGSDGLPLGIGEGGEGVGLLRNGGSGISKIKKRIPRNAPALWNLGAKEISNIMHDGRISISDIFQNNFNTPAEEWLPLGLDNILAAQALFPMTRQFEMSGNPGENEIVGNNIVDLSHRRLSIIWPILAKRVSKIPEYQNMFIEAFNDINSPQDISIIHLGNAISAFISLEWRSIDSPFDDFLNGNETALSDSAKKGMNLFFGKANCSSCHSGKLFTDQKFYALALPHFGPGRTRRFDPFVRDIGRMGESDKIEDAYRFRTPSLRNVSLTAPYGHNGAYETLEDIIKHHLDPKKMHKQWNPSMVNLPSVEWLSDIDFISFSDKYERNRLISKIDIDKVALSESEIKYLVQFLKSLTGKSMNNRPFGIPSIVPSGIEVDK